MANATAGSALRALAVQTGPAEESVEANLAAAEEAAADAHNADLVVFPELFSRPFWCLGDSDPRYFEWAEDVDGPTLSAAADWARSWSATVVVPFFERGRVAGEYYNSAAVLGPDGQLIPGRLPGGAAVTAYRKNAVSAYRWGDQVNDEKFYFRPGQGYAVFDTPRARIGVLICLDRWFPEAWRVLALAGAEVVCVVNASQGSVSDLFVPSMRTCAAQNLVFTVAVNKVGDESVAGRSVRYYGQSCIVDPLGDVLAAAGGDKPEAISAELWLEDVRSARTERTIYRDRRPELYRSLVEDQS
jgi:N-carbamoylputrescine amidase